MLAVDIQSLYESRLASRNATRDLIVRPVYGGNRDSSRNPDDFINLSQQGRSFAKFLTEQNKDGLATAYRDPVEWQNLRRAEQIRGQVLQYFLGIGLPMMEAIPQTEKIIARMGYQSRRDDGGDEDRPEYKSRGGMPQNTKTDNKLSTFNGKALNILV